MRVEEVITEEDLDLYLKKCRKIKLIKVKNNRKFTLAKKLLTNRYPTYYKNNNLHCSSGKYRSFYDVIRVLKFHYPKMNIKEIILLLEKYLNLPVNKRRSISWCPHIKRMNFRILYNNYFTIRTFYETPLKKCGFPNCNLTIGDIINN